MVITWGYLSSSLLTLSLPSLQDKKIEEGLNAIPTLPKSEIVKRLRDRGQPILLFGETLINACERLKQVEMDAPDAVGIQASGSTNDFK